MSIPVSPKVELALECLIASAVGCYRGSASRINNIVADAMTEVSDTARKIVSLENQRNRFAEMAVRLAYERPESDEDARRMVGDAVEFSPHYCSPMECSGCGNKWVLIHAVAYGVEREPCPKCGHSEQVPPSNDPTETSS